MKLNREQVLDILAKNRDAIRACGARRLGLFGSVARGEPDGDSDLDFVVELSPKTFDAYMDVKFLLEDLFGRSVDLVLMGAIKPLLRERILSEAIHVPGL